MELNLSQQSEQYLQQLVAGGLYPSTAAALEAAVAALRERGEQDPLVPEEHMAAVEQGLASAAGLARPFIPADWARLRQIAHDAAS
jgi:Arc/MetJ-type ribon-helix-helix transcriptional regulator